MAYRAIFAALGTVAWVSACSSGPSDSARDAGTRGPLTEASFPGALADPSRTFSAEAAFACLGAIRANAPSCPVVSSGHRRRVHANDRVRPQRGRRRALHAVPLRGGPRRRARRAVHPAGASAAGLSCRDTARYEPRGEGATGRPDAAGVDGTDDAFVCTGGACVARRPNGAACTDSGECRGRRSRDGKCASRAYTTEARSGKR